MNIYFSNHSALRVELSTIPILSYVTIINYKNIKDVLNLIIINYQSIINIHPDTYTHSYSRYIKINSFKEYLIILISYNIHAFK